GAGATAGNGGSGGEGAQGASTPTNCDEDGDGHECDSAACGGDDCDDTDIDIHPGADEICGDGVDNNCDGAIDEGCECDPGETVACYGGSSSTREVGECRDGDMTCSSHSAWGTCVGDVTPVDEDCDNGLDEDCDGDVDDADSDCDTGNGTNHGCVVGPSVQRTVNAYWTSPASYEAEEVEVAGGWLQQPGMDPVSGDFAQMSFDPASGKWVGYMGLMSGTYLEYTTHHHSDTCQGWSTNQCCYAGGCEGCNSDFGTNSITVDGAPLQCTRLAWKASETCNTHIVCCIP
ncbi:MAG: MopE-related protein, partial [Patescibacteria group bacterium]